MSNTFSLSRSLFLSLPEIELCAPVVDGAARDLAE